MSFLFKLILTQDFKYVKEMQAEQLLLKRMYRVQGTWGSCLPSPYAVPPLAPVAPRRNSGGLCRRGRNSSLGSAVFSLFSLSKSLSSTLKTMNLIFRDHSLKLQSTTLKTNEKKKKSCLFWCSIVVFGHCF